MTAAEASHRQKSTATHSPKIWKGDCNIITPKTMKTNNRKFAGRFAAIVLAVVLMLATLVGCGSKATLPTASTMILEDGHSLDSIKVTKIVEMFQEVYSAEYDPREELVAAMRGHNMVDYSCHGSDAECGKAGDLGINMTYVKAVLDKANNAATKNKVDTAIYAEINEADVHSLVNSFKTKADNGQGGLFDGLLKAIGKIVSWLTDTISFDIYLIGICIFAILIEIVMLPFAIKQQKNSIKQAKLRPKEMAIRNKYRGRTDQVTMQKMQQEIQEFYQRENFSPYSGCLQLLLQLPIIMALYSIIIDPLRYMLGMSAGASSALSAYCTAAQAAGGAGMTLSGNGGTIALLSQIRENAGALNGLKDFMYFTDSEAIFNAISPKLSEIPNFNIGPINFGFLPSFAQPVLLLVPVLTFLTYFLTSKLNRKFMYQPAVNEGADARQVACSNSMMDITMPAMSTFFTFMVPALVGVYWMFRSLVGLLKQFIISRLMPIPTFTEEDYRAAAKEMAGKKTVKKSSNAGKVRSLHYIDDEDFEDTRERGLARRAAIEEREREEQAKKAQKSAFGAPSIKEDRKDKKNETKPEKTEVSEEPIAAEDLTTDAKSTVEDLTADNVEAMTENNDIEKKDQE